MILSHTLSFLSSSTVDKNSPKNNIIAITEEDQKKHFIQYIEYQKEKEGIALRYINIKVDRCYYLEIANINIDNNCRKRLIFSILGKRRFGANSKRIDYYLLNQNLKHSTLDELYRELNEGENFKACFTQKTEYSINEYRIHPVELENSTIYFLDQKNRTQRKKLHKTFAVELQPQDVKTLYSIESSKKRIEYLFNKIGKIHFKSLDIKYYKLSETYTEHEDLALSNLLHSSDEMEVSSRVNDNLVFRKLKEKSEISGRVDIRLQESYLALLKKPHSVKAITRFYDATDDYLHCVADIQQLDDVASYFLDLKSLVQAGTLPYLLDKNDNDLEDIFLYMLESFNTWAEFLHAQEEDTKMFNLATIDFKDSLRHLIDSCYKFKHEYKCHETTQIKEIVYVSDTIITSAESYFSEVTLDNEVYDELLELESEISILDYSKEWSDELNSILISFLDGYTSALNPLFEFKDLSYSLMLLSQKLQEYKKDENAEILIVLLRSFISDLLTWKEAVLVAQTAEDIHYMDKSFYSNIAQIEMSMGQRDTNEEEDEIEFF